MVFLEFYRVPRVQTENFLGDLKILFSFHITFGNPIFFWTCRNFFRMIRLIQAATQKVLDFRKFHREIMDIYQGNPKNICNFQNFLSTFWFSPVVLQALFILSINAVRVLFFHLIWLLPLERGGPSEGIIFHACITNNNKVIFNSFENSPERYWPILEPCKRNEGHWLQCNSNHIAINNINCPSLEYSF